MFSKYPVKTTRDKNGTVVAEFPDVPEAMTVGKNLQNALEWAKDALLVALAGYMEDRKDIPKPSKPGKVQKTVGLPPMAEIKLSIYQAMRDQKMTQAALGERIGVDGRQVRRILDIDHNTSFPLLERSLKALDLELIVDVHKAA